MRTDIQLYTLLGADAEFLRVLTDGIEIRGGYVFEALDVKGLNRRSDGVLLPESVDEPIWVIEFQAQRDPLIYHRLLIEMGLIGERHHPRLVRGFLLFLSAAQDPRTQPWDALLARDAEAPVRRGYLAEILGRLRERDPGHPLLAVCLPLLVDDLEQLRAEAPASYGRLKVSNVPETARRHLLDVFQTWLMARFKTLSLKEILTMLGELAPLEETRAYQELVAQGRAIGRKEGKKEGQEEGRKEGREGEARALIRRQLLRRLGRLTPAQDVRLGTLSLEDSEALGEALLDFMQPEELDLWLARH